MAKVFVSEKQIVSIDEFMNSYLGIKYDRKEKLTHRNMECFLYEKGRTIPKRVSFDTVTKEKLLTGDYITVKDEANKILIYKNPRKSLDMLCAELNTERNKKIIKQKRKEVLYSMGLIDTNMGVLDKEDLEKEEYRIEKENRQKQFVICKNKYLRKKHY